MYIASHAGAIALSLPIFLFVASSSIAGDGSSKGSYQSPTAVFNAYRQAGAKRDLRKLFSCYTPRVQDGVVFDSFFASAERNSKEDIAIFDKGEKRDITDL